MIFVEQYLNFTPLLLKILCNLCSLWKCLPNKFRSIHAIFVDAVLLHEGLYQIMFPLLFLADLFSIISPYHFIIYGKPVFSNSVLYVGAALEKTS